MINAAPACSVWIYTFEGGKYHLEPESHNLLAVTTNKPIEGTGSFTITLAPGGPNGTTVFPSWADVITPNALVMIYMERGDKEGMAMIGLVDTIEETQAWPVNSPTRVERATVIQGRDFFKVLATFSYYTLATFGFALPMGGNKGVLPGLISDSGLYSGTPGAVSHEWLIRVVNSILNKLTWKYDDGSLTLPEVFSYIIQNFNHGRTQIPFNFNFLTEEGTWINKLKGVLSAPWYEVFVTTAPEGYYDGYKDFSDPSSKSFIGPHDIHWKPVFVARQSPMPWVTPGDTLDISAWKQLKEHRLSPENGDTFFAFERQRSDKGVRNVYIPQVTTPTTLNGNKSPGWSAFLMQYGFHIDVNSLDRFGYRPEVVSTPWFSDPTASNENNPVREAVEDLSSFLASYYEGAPYMWSASMSMPLRPDIMIGERLIIPFTQETPYRGESASGYEWYITGVRHNYIYGGSSSTKLTLERGLPEAYYNDSKAMKALLQGNGWVDNGHLGYSDKATNLQSVDPSRVSGTGGIGAIVKELPSIFATPGAK